MKIKFKYIIIFLMQQISCNPDLYMSQPDTKQDKFLNEHIFRNKKNGVFVDIGAHDGVSYSNTYFFEKYLNWTGICIEPLSEEFEKLKQNRTCICLNTCVSDIEGFVNFIVVENKQIIDQYFNCNMFSGIASTYNEEGLNTLKKNLAQYNVIFKEVSLPSKTLGNILKENNISNVDYLSIDVEGCELAILKTIDFTKININVMSIENNYKTTDIRDYLEKNGFVLFITLTQDEIYINKNYKIYSL